MQYRSLQCSSVLCISKHDSYSFISFFVSVFHMCVFKWTTMFCLPCTRLNVDLLYCKEEIISGMNSFRTIWTCNLMKLSLVHLFFWILLLFWNERKSSLEARDCIPQSDKLIFHPNFDLGISSYKSDNLTTGIFGNWKWASGLYPQKNVLRGMWFSVVCL